MLEELSVVGKRLPLIGGVEKATGTALFTADIKLPGMLYGKALRSPYAHAKVVKLDTSKAEKLPGVRAVVTGKDVPHKKYTCNIMTYQLPEPEIFDRYLFDTEVRYVGEPIAAVAAVSEEIAEEALGLIDVEWEVLPAVFNITDAQKPGAPKLHDFAEGNVAAANMPLFPYGDVQKGFEEADIVVEDTFHTTKQIQCGLEPESVIAYFDHTGRLTVWSHCQLPHMLRRMLAYLFDLPEGKVRVIQPFTGSGFGGGTAIVGEDVCSALAIKARAPVKMVWTRAEDFACRATREHIAELHAKIGVKKDGTPVAMELKVTGDAGAYMGKEISGCAVCLASNITNYEFQNMNNELTVVYTNHLNCEAMRGFGGMQSTFAREVLVDEVCEKLGMDPIDFRIKYHRKPGGLGWFPGTAITSCGVEECLRIGAEKIGWKEKRAAKKEGTRRRGVGMAMMAWLSGAQPMLLEHSNATLKFNADGSCSLFVSPGIMGQGILGTLAQIAAEELGLNYEDISVVYGDTDLTEWSVGTHASRGVYCIGRAVKKAAEDAKAQLIERASKMLGVAADELEMKNRRIYVKANPEKGLSVAEVAEDSIYSHKGDAHQITVHASLEPTEFAPPWQAGFAEVEVDTETGEVKLLHWITVHDIGRAINPMVVEGQLFGGAAQGIGFALWEDTVISQENGRMVTDGFDTYKIASTLDIPEKFEVVLVEEGDPTGPFGAKSVGESGIFTMAPAIANAIYNAVGVRINDLPITPEKILKALKEKEKKEKEKS